jgi:DNA mismatch endonuclease, patch repair protein
MNTEYWSAKLARNSARDAQVTAELEEAGWTVVRVWEHEDTHDAATRIERSYRRLNRMTG